MFLFSQEGEEIVDEPIFKAILTIIQYKNLRVFPHTGRDACYDEDQILYMIRHVAHWIVKTVRFS